MDILKSDMPYNCYCGTGEADRFASAYIFDGRHKADPATVKIAIVSDRIVSGFYYNSFENLTYVVEVYLYNWYYIFVVN